MFRKQPCPSQGRNSRGHRPSGEAPGGRRGPHPQPTVLPGGITARRRRGSQRSSRPGLREVTAGAAGSRGCPAPHGHYPLLCGERRQHRGVPTLGEREPVSPLHSQAHPGCGSSPWHRPQLYSALTHMHTPRLQLPECTEQSNRTPRRLRTLSCER